MGKLVRSWRVWVAVLGGAAAVAAILVSLVVFGADRGTSLTATPYSDVIRFEAAGAASLDVRVFDLSGKELWSSGVVSDDVVDWNRTNTWGERLAYGSYLYSAQAWDARGGLLLDRTGKLALLPGDKVQLQAAPALPTLLSEALSFGDDRLTVQPMGVGDTGIFGTVGINTASPTQRLHLKDGNMLLESTSGTVRQYFYSPLRKYMFFTSGSDGAFGIYDIDASQRRLTVATSGNVGIGTDSPTQELQVHGSFPQEKLTNTLNSNWFTLGTGSVGFSFDDNAGNEPFIIYYGTPSDTMNLLASGAVIIGGDTGPTGRLEVRGDIGGHELCLYESETTGYPASSMQFDTSSATDWEVGASVGYDTFFIYDDSAGWNYVIINPNTGQITLWGDVVVNGDLYADGYYYNASGSPQEIRSSSLEGPQVTTSTRGSGTLVDGEAVIVLPDAFAKATSETGLTVTLTPTGTWLELYVVEKTADRIVVQEASGRTGTFDYLVQGTRSGDSSQTAAASPTSTGISAARWTQRPGDPSPSPLAPEPEQEKPAQRVGEGRNWLGSQ